MKQWHKNYLQSVSIIESTAMGMYRTLCSFVSKHSDQISTTKLLEDLKEGRPTDWDTKMVAWGKGSSVHSLVDCLQMFVEDKDLQRHLKELFVRKSRLEVDLQMNEVSNLDQET